MLKKLDRYEESILLVLFEVYPLALSQDEIISRIKERGLIEMTEEQFKEYARELRATKGN